MVAGEGKTCDNPPVVPVHPSRPEDRAVSSPQTQPTHRIAVAIPCYNEAAAIAAVVADFRSALPGADILVLDNNSSDGTGDLARGLGVRVIDVPEQGKGFAVRRAFAELADRDIVVLVDGDGTYPAALAGELVAPVAAGVAEMTVGARRPVDQPGSMTPVRGLGNVLIRTAFRVLIGPGQGDLLSGYRAFSRRFRETVRLESAGFEIESEIAAEAVARGLAVVEVPVPYHPRIAGTTSKLKAFRDGRRILKMIVARSLANRPWRPLWLLAGVLLVPAAPLRSWPLLVVAAIPGAVGLGAILLRGRALTSAGSPAPPPAPPA